MVACKSSIQKGSIRMVRLSILSSKILSFQHLDVKNTKLLGRNFNKSECILLYDLLTVTA